MTKLFLGSPIVSFAALIGDNVIRIKDGRLKQIEQIPIYSPPIESLSIGYGLQFSSIPHELIGNKINLNIETSLGGFEWCHYTEPISTLPIGDKRVDDCTIEELLFAVKHKLTK